MNTLLGHLQSKKIDKKFELKSPYKAMGDQPQAIQSLSEGVLSGEERQILLGVTGSGKTFTMASIIEKVQRPTLIIAHNKTLAGQLCEEFRAFFPNNRVEYFISYYDYYQPEAYIPATDTYIEKDSAINDEIDRMRHSATASLLERRDVIIVASVSCIYGLGNPETYAEMMVHLRQDQEISRESVMDALTRIQYTRNDFDFRRGTFRARGDTLDIFPAAYDRIFIRVSFFGDEIERIQELEAISGRHIAYRNYVRISPASHYATDDEHLEKAIKSIEEELEEQLKVLNDEGKTVEAYRLEQRTRYDIEMLKETHFCKGIENYTRHMDGRLAGEPPKTLMDYFPDDYLLLIDESHVTMPQISAMYNGDRSRKLSLIDYGFRLPSAADNRPLKFQEFEERMGQTIFVSATPGNYETEHSRLTVEQVIRPTGLLDPEIEIHEVSGQIDYLLEVLKPVIERDERALVLTLTKKMAEDFTDFLQEQSIRVRYLHSDIANPERLSILRDLRKGEFDVLVGINLLREGLDLPEVSLVAIFDADKEGFLRSTGSLIQMIGRAARNERGRVLLFADKITDSMYRAISETNRRRKIQSDYNKANGLVPKTVKKDIREALDTFEKLVPKSKKGSKRIEAAFSKRESPEMKIKRLSPLERLQMAESLEQEMKEAAKNLDFETAASLRDLLILARSIDEK